MCDEKRFESLVDQVYQATLNASPWPEFLSKFADALNGRRPGNEQFDQLRSSRDAELVQSL